MNAPEPRIWKSPGPVSTAFMNSTAPIHGIMGPVGGGKTSTALMNAYRLAHMQAPNAAGVRKSRWTAVRADYRRLWSSLIPTWWHWRPKELGTWTGGKNEPAEHRFITEPLPDGTTVDFWLDFIAIGDNRAEDVLRGFEPTGFLLNEADLLHSEVLDYTITRTGRYPKMEDGGPSWHGILMDFNAPDEDSYLYPLIMDPPDGYEFYIQPSGRSPNAENLDNLPAGYYERQVKLLRKPWLIRRMVDNQFGYSRDGEPIYKDDFNDDFHVARNPLKAVEGLGLQIGVDAGRTPAAVIRQRMPDGQRRYLHEICAQGMGAETFGKLLAREITALWPWAMARRDLIEGWGDPAASFAGDQSEYSWLEIVSNASGIRFQPAPVQNNDLTIRLEAVRFALNDNPGGQPGLLLSPTCKVLRRGFNSGYRYRRMKIANQERYDDKPDKNDYSHPHDALQYVEIGAGERSAILGRRRDSEEHFARGQIRAADEEYPDGVYAGERRSPHSRHQFRRGRGRQAYAEE